MGNCLQGSALTISKDVSYSSRVAVTVPSTSKRVKLRLNGPHSQTAQTLKVGTLVLTANSCALDGIDVSAGRVKDSQESSFQLVVEEAALMGVFDGHGKEGKKVVEFCSEWFQSYFKQHKEEFRADARVALVQAFERCDVAVKLEIECMLSGR